MAVTKLKKPVIRRIGDLVVRMDTDGITVRGTRKRKSWSVSWERVLSLVDLADEDTAVLKAIEKCNGTRVLRKLTAPSRPPRKKV